MYLDNNLVFSDGQLSTFSGTSTASTYSIDLTGGGNFSVGPNASVFGEDIGPGDGVAIPKVVVMQTSTVAMSSGNSATLNVQFQGSTDSSTWTTYVESGAIAAASLTVSPSRIWVVDVPMRQVQASMPRYLRLNYVLPGGTSFAGVTNSTISAFILLGQDTSMDTLKLYPSGFSVGV